MKRSSRVFFILATLLLSGQLWDATWAEAPLPMPPEEVVLQYGRAFYARDLATAYRFISAEDRRLKDEESYIRERGAFRGFTLAVSKQLARFIEAVSVEKTLTENHAEVTLKVRLPNANAPLLQELLLAWDEEKLNALPHREQETITQRLAQWHTEGKIPFIEGEEKFTLLQETEGWRVFLHWAAGAKLLFHTLVPASLPLEATPVQKEVLTPLGEVVQVYFRVKNRSQHNVSTRITHHVAPTEMAEYLELVECGLLLPVHLAPGGEEDYFSLYAIRGDLPHAQNQFEITYEFVPVDNDR